MKKELGMILLGMILTTAASGAIVFQDDFSGDLSQWDVSGDTALVSETLNVTQQSGPGQAYAGTKQQWTAGGQYTLTFDTDANTYPNANPEPTYDHVWTRMPGGLQVKYGYWDNGGAIAFKGTNLATGINVGPNVQWRTIRMTLDSDTLAAEVFVNGGAVWSGTLPSAPDFSTYNKVEMLSHHTTYWNSYDNMTLDYVPEPATLALMGFGGVFALLRRRK